MTRSSSSTDDHPWREYFRDLLADSAHIAISVALFAGSLALPFVYDGPQRSGASSFVLLLFGWFGIIYGYVSWFANPLYLAALVTFRRPRTSAVLGLVALLLALSVLLYDAFADEGQRGSVAAYGWGYALWVAAIAYLTVVQFCRLVEMGGTVTAILGGVTLAAVASLQWVQVSRGPDSQQAFERKRDELFSEKCQQTGQKIFLKVKDAEGVFFEGNTSTTYRKEDSGWWITGSSSPELLYLMGGLLAFYETGGPDGAESLAFFRHYIESSKGSSEPKFQDINTSRLESKYGVIGEYAETPAGISWGTVIIKNLHDGTILAATTYAYDEANHRFCGHAPDGVFSQPAFVTDVLGLSKRYPSFNELRKERRRGGGTPE